MVSDMKKIEAMARAWCRSIHVNPDKWDEKNDCHEWVNAMPTGVGLLKDYEAFLAQCDGTQPAPAQLAA